MAACDNYFYYEIIRKTIIAYGALFNQICVKHNNKEGEVVSQIKVPIAYGPTQKFLARLEQSPSDLNNPVQITLPRMSFELTGIVYDPARKVTTPVSFQVPVTSTDSKGNEVTKTETKSFMPVPYNFQFELSIYTKLNDDMLQIIEQILPYFQPAYTMTVNLIDMIGEYKDVPVVFENITLQDTYEGDFTTRRALYYTLRFTTKGFLYGPLYSGGGGSGGPGSGGNAGGNIGISTDGIVDGPGSGAGGGLPGGGLGGGSLGGGGGLGGGQIGGVTEQILKARIGLAAGGVSRTPGNRKITYAVEPRAVESYTDNTVAKLKEDITFENTTLELTDVSKLGVNQYITIGVEEMRIREIAPSLNKIVVQRGMDGTTITQHIKGADVQLITKADNALIDTGDIFGFDDELF